MGASALALACMLGPARATATMTLGERFEIPLVAPTARLDLSGPLFTADGPGMGLLVAPTLGGERLTALRLDDAGAATGAPLAISPLPGVAEARPLAVERLGERWWLVERARGFDESYPSQVYIRSIDERLQLGIPFRMPVTVGPLDDVRVAASSGSIEVFVLAPAIGRRPSGARVTLRASDSPDPVFERLFIADENLAGGGLLGLAPGWRAFAVAQEDTVRISRTSLDGVTVVRSNVALSGAGSRLSVSAVVAGPSGGYVVTGPDDPAIVRLDDAGRVVDTVPFRLTSARGGNIAAYYVGSASDATRWWVLTVERARTAGADDGGFIGLRAFSFARTGDPDVRATDLAAATPAPNARPASVGSTRNGSLLAWDTPFADARVWRFSRWSPGSEITRIRATESLEMGAWARPVGAVALRDMWLFGWFQDPVLPRFCWVRASPSATALRAQSLCMPTGARLLDGATPFMAGDADGAIAVWTEVVEVADQRPHIALVVLPFDATGRALVQKGIVVAESQPGDLLLRVSDGRATRAGRDFLLQTVNGSGVRRIVQLDPNGLSVPFAESLLIASSGATPVGAMAGTNAGGAEWIGFGPGNVASSWRYASGGHKSGDRSAPAERHQEELFLGARLLGGGVEAFARLSDGSTGLPSVVRLRAASATALPEVSPSGFPQGLPFDLVPSPAGWIVPLRAGSEASDVTILRLNGRGEPAPEPMLQVTGDVLTRRFAGAGVTDGVLFEITRDLTTLLGGHKLWVRRLNGTPLDGATTLSVFPPGAENPIPGTDAGAGPVGAEAGVPVQPGTDGGVATGPDAGGTGSGRDRDVPAPGNGGGTLPGGCSTSPGPVSPSTAFPLAVIALALRAPRRRTARISAQP